MNPFKKTKKSDLDKLKENPNPKKLRKRKSNWRSEDRDQRDRGR